MATAIVITAATITQSPGALSGAKIHISTVSGNRNTNVSGNTVNINNEGNRNKKHGHRGNNVGSQQQRKQCQPAKAEHATGLRHESQRAERRERPGAKRRCEPSWTRRRRQRAQPHPLIAVMVRRRITAAKTSAFGGYNSGGNTRAQSSRGQSSMGGGGEYARPQPEAEPTDGSRLVGERIQPKRWNSRTEVDDVGSQQADY